MPWHRLHAIRGFPFIGSSYGFETALKRQMAGEQNSRWLQRKYTNLPAKGTLVVGTYKKAVALDIETLQTRVLYRAEEGFTIKSAIPLSGLEGDLLLVLRDDRAYVESLYRLSAKTRELTKLQEGFDIGVPVVSRDGSTFAWISRFRDKQIKLGIAPAKDFGRARYFLGDLFVDNTGPSWIECAEGRSKLLVTLSNGTIAIFDEQSSSFTPKTRGYSPYIFDGEDRFLFIDGDYYQYLAIFDQGRVRRMLQLFYGSEGWYSTIRTSPDGKYAATMGPISCRILGWLDKVGPGLVLIDLTSGKTEKVYAKVDGLNVNFLGGPWAWVSK